MVDGSFEQEVCEILYVLLDERRRWRAGDATIRIAFAPIAVASFSPECAKAVREISATGVELDKTNRSFG